MAREILLSKKTEQGLRLDPRTKLLLIFIMDHGKMVATGKHQELIQACPEYQKLWKAAQDSAEWKVSTAKEGR